MVHVSENTVLKKRFAFGRVKVSGKFKIVPQDPVHYLCEVHSIVRIVIQMKYNRLDIKL
jgi:hypothetical protein